MEVQIIKAFKYQGRKFRVGYKTEVEKWLGQEWLKNGLAKPTTGAFELEQEIIKRALPDEEE